MAPAGGLTMRACPATPKAPLGETYVRRPHFTVPVSISALGKKSWEDHEYKSSLGYILTACLQSDKQTKPKEKIIIT